MAERADDSPEAPSEGRWGDTSAGSVEDNDRRFGWSWLLLAVVLLGIVTVIVVAVREEPPLRPNPRALAAEEEVLTRAVLPAEFERQEALLLVWPPHDWGKEAAVAIAVAVTPEMPIVLLIQGDKQRQDASAALREAGVSLSQIRFTECATNSIWIRDFGPLLVDGPDKATWVVDAIYVVPGGVPRLADENLPSVFAQTFGIPAHKPQIVWEMGGILSNGAGLCLVSRRLLQQNLKLGISEAYVTQTLKSLFGAREVRYLSPLIEETTGHLDWFAVFTAPDTLVIGEYAAEVDRVNSELLNSHADELAGLETAAGPLKVVRIPMPARGSEFFGGTFTNVVFANGKLLVPSWSDASQEDERAAHEVYGRLLPDWKIVPIKCDELGHHGGALRCVTMNLHRFEDSSGQAPSRHK